MTSATSVLRKKTQCSAGLRFLLPSVTDLIFVLLLLALSTGALAPRLLGDADIGWHIRDGQNILSTHAIPHTDSFSATMNGHRWYAWEWLYDLVVGMIYNRLSLNGVVFVSALMIAATLSLVFRLTLKRGSSVPIEVVFLLVCIIASSIHFLARPHLVSWLMTVIWFWILDSANRNAGRDGRLFWLPILMLLWANLHGGFIVGFVLLGIFLVADLLASFSAMESKERQRAEQQAKNHGLILLLSALASLVNPYGYKLHVHIYHYLSNRFFMTHIDEFRPPNFRGLPADFFLLLVLLTGLAILTARGKLRWAEWLLLIFSLFSGLRAARNIPVASMLLTMIAAPLFSRERAQPAVTGASSISRLRTFAERMSRTELSLRGHLWLIACTLVLTWICFSHGEFLGRQVMSAEFSEQKFPVRAVNVLSERGIHEPVFTLDSWGGYLIYRLYPAVKVFVDDRHDFYGEAFLRNYLKIIHAEPGWQGILYQEHVNLILVPAKSTLADALRNSAEWKITYGDNVATVFEREKQL